MKQLLFTIFLCLGFVNHSAAQDVFVNEVNYASAILAERGVGIAGPAGTDLSGWGITIYNNTGGVESSTNITNAIIPNQQSDRGEFFVDVGVNLTENQGVALIDDAGQVVQFVNFGPLGGVITAIGGIANGLTSTYIGFHTNMQSLQLSGTGCESGDFVWAAQSPTTPGAVNTSQTFDGCTASVLPIDFILFEGETTQRGIILEWSTASEVNNANIVVERSVDGDGFEAIGRLEGQGTVDALTDYEFLDTELVGAIHYYRLQQNDFDGTASYSNIISVRTNIPNITVKVYPNPFNEQFELSFSAPQSGSVEILNAQGQRIYASPLNNQMKINLNDFSAPSGVYYLKIVTQSTSSITTIIKN